MNPRWSRRFSALPAPRLWRWPFCACGARAALPPRSWATCRLPNRARRAPPRDKAEFGAAVWFSLSVGHEGRAEARWLLPKICDAGSITRSDIGAIRVQQRETFVQIAEAAAPRFGASMDIDQGLTLTRMDSAPDLDRAAPARGRPAFKPSDRPQGPTRKPYTPRERDDGDAAPRPVYKPRPLAEDTAESIARKPYAKARDEDRKPFTPRDEGDRKPYAKPFARREDDARKPYARAEDGPRKPYAKRDEGDRKPYTPRDEGDRKPYAKPADGPRNPYAKASDGPRKPYVKREDGDRKPYTPREDGDRKPYARSEDGPRKPFAKRDDSERKPYAKPADGPRKSYGASSDAPRKPRAVKSAGADARPARAPAPRPDFSDPSVSLRKRPAPAGKGAPKGFKPKR